MILRSLFWSTEFLVPAQDFGYRQSFSPMTTHTVGLLFTALLGNSRIAFEAAK
jgi:hypothetical protein